MKIPFNSQWVRFTSILVLLARLGLPLANAGEPTKAVVDSLKFNGEFTEEDASFVLSGSLKGGKPGEEEKLIYTLHSINEMAISRTELSQTSQVQVSVVQGKLEEVILAMKGDGEVTDVSGEKVRYWGLRQNKENQKFLVVRLVESKTAIKDVAFRITTRTRIEDLPLETRPITFAPEAASLHDGFIKIEKQPELDVELVDFSGITPIDPEYFPGLVKSSIDEDNKPLTFRFLGTHPTLTLRIKEADPDARKVVFDDFSLTGSIQEGVASFVLTGVAKVRYPEGGHLRVLSGDAALTGLQDTNRFKIHYRNFYLVREGDTLSRIAREHQTTVQALQEANQLEGDRILAGQRLIIPNPDWMNGYILDFDKPGTYPVELRFNARIRERDGWKEMNFDVAPSALRPFRLKGLPEDTQFSSTTTAKPERVGEDFVSFLPSAGNLWLRWKEAKPEEEGKLFYSVEGVTEISVSPGLMRQTHLMNLKVMQGEMSQLAFAMDGEGEVVRVSGPDVLAWNVETVEGNRRLIVRLNQAKKEDFSLTVYIQRPLGVFPLQFQPLALRPEEAVRYGGHLRVVNDGAVRLEVTNASGLSQISPEHFPQSEVLGAITDTQRTQVFAYRFSDAAFSLEIQADNILPELTVSQILLYHAGETEARLDAEIELDIREAPLREFTLQTPMGYAVSQLQSPYLSDYFLTQDEENQTARLRVVFSQPLTGRQLIQLRLERNRDLVEEAWALPKLIPEGVKSVRGYVGVSADTGVRLTESASDGLTEIAPAFFPRKVEGLQLAWRMRDENWSATATIERMALSIQVDAVHLFSIGEGIIYGSSVMNYLISGAPVSVLKFQTPADYGNIEFSGKDVRNWKQTDEGYEVYLHSPVFGSYTLLATYDRKFSAQGENLSFEGVQPLEVQSDQGNVIVISDYQFQVTPATVSLGLIALEPAEIPAEHRLLFAAPILAAYQYISRPFNLELELTPLEQGQTMQQVVDRAAIQTRVSSQGQSLTEATYLIKSKGHSHLRVTIPDGVELWESNVNGENVVAVADGADTLIPLPRNANPNEIIELKLKLASKSPNKKNVRVALSSIAAPVLLTDWKVVPDESYRLIYRNGSLDPDQGAEDVSGFNWLFKLLQGRFGDERMILFFSALGFIVAGGLLLREVLRKSDLKRKFVYWSGLGLGVVLLAAAVIIFGSLAIYATNRTQTPTASLSFSVPIQEAGVSNFIQVKNQSMDVVAPSVLMFWPIILAVGVWIYGYKSENAWTRKCGLILGWMCAFWAALRAPNGGSVFFAALLIFFLVHLIVPLLRSHWEVLRQRASLPDAGGAATLLMVGLLCCISNRAAAEVLPKEESPKSTLTSVVQHAIVKDQLVEITATLKWDALENARLDFLRQPAVLTQIQYPTNALKLTESTANYQPVHRLTAEKSGTYVIEFTYQLRAAQQRGEQGFHLPTAYGLINQITLDVENQDVDVYSPNAVSVKKTYSDAEGRKQTHAELALLPRENAWIAWHPRSRDTSEETAAFYAELTHLFVPSAGVVDGIHDLQVRLAQGQLGELTLQVPENFTIANVEAPFVSTWRFDPDSRKLRVQFSSPQSGSFVLRVKSQVATQPLPYTQAIELISVDGASGQVGQVGLATGEEVQLNQVAVENLTPINLEDFPRQIVSDASGQFSGLTLRRAYRYSDLEASLNISAAAVEPDVRVTSHETLSIGTDRIVLASDLGVTISRAGVFKLSFALPENMEVESLSGDAMSHWTELESDGQRIITIHLKNKTLGQQSFAVTLAGQGLGEQTALEAPRLVIREASKQNGQLVVVPEQGLRLHVNERESVTQLDPQRAGIQQRGVLAFRLLQKTWRLSFDVEQVEPWIQVTTLQDVTVREGQVKVTAHFDYQIENTGVKSLALLLPAAAESVVFSGDYITDSIRSESQDTNLANWEIKLSRRVIGNYRLQATYQMVVPVQSTDYTIRGIQVQNVNLQRGYLAIRAGGRLQVEVPELPSALQPSDWQNIPATLLQGLDVSDANFTFRAIEPAFELPIRLVRHEIARVLPARVQQVDLTSTISRSGEMLTEVRVTLDPGDKRLLRLKLPANSEFWFAFVNNESVWPWRDGDEILIPLEKNSDASQPATADFFYTGQLVSRSGSFNYRVMGPEFDLPLKDITWKMFVSDKWTVDDWDDRWQLKTLPVLLGPQAASIDAYIATEEARQQEKTKQAEVLLDQGNQYLQQGAPQQARKAYRAAWELSQHDAAFNEDARVQLQNLKTQQALMGLNFRRNNFLQQQVQQPEGQQAAAAGIQLGREPSYTQQEAKQIIESNTAEENTALMRLAQRLVNQQEAAVEKADAIHATLPEEGQLLAFTRSLHVDTWSNLQIDLEASLKSSRAWTYRLICLVLITVVAGALALLGKRPKSVE